MKHNFSQFCELFPVPCGQVWQPRRHQTTVKHLLKMLLQDFVHLDYKTLQLLEYLKKHNSICSGSLCEGQHEYTQKV